MATDKFLGVALTVFLAIGCDSTPRSTVGTAHQKLTDSQARILGFESPSTDWTATNGVSIASSGNAAQGSFALAVAPQG